MKKDLGNFKFNFIDACFIYLRIIISEHVYLIIDVRFKIMSLHL